MGYRGFTFPLLNVTEIEIKKLDWTTKIYSRQQAQGAKRIWVTAQQIWWYIQKFLNPEN
jgi:hypothetical protein